MTERKKPPHLIPNFKEQVVRLFQKAGPAWMMGALIVLTLPLLFVSLGFALQGLAQVLKVFH